jgi:hypothetical protein
VTDARDESRGAPPQEEAHSSIGGTKPPKSRSSISKARSIERAVKTPDAETDRTLDNGQQDSGKPPVDDQFDRKMRRFAQLLVLAGAFCFGAVFIMGAIGTIATQMWVVELAQKHFAATVGLPFAALAAICLVVILEINAGRIEMRGLGFTFRGAAGPIIMWIFCFLAIVSAIKLVWNLE